MNYKIIWSDLAIDFLRKSDKQLAKRIHKKIGELENNPFRPLQRVVDRPYFKTRIGDYRALIRVDTANFELHISKVDRRSRIYKNLPF